MKNIRARLVAGLLVAVVAGVGQSDLAASDAAGGPASTLASTRTASPLSGREVLARFADRTSRLVNFHGFAEHRSDVAAVMPDLTATLVQQGHQLAAGPGDGRIFTGSQSCEIGSAAQVYHLAAPDGRLWVDIVMFSNADDAAKLWPTLRRSLPSPNSGNTGKNRAMIYSHTETGSSVAVALFYNGDQMVNVGRRLSVAVPLSLDESTSVSAADRERIWRTADGELSELYAVTRAVVGQLVCADDLDWIPSADVNPRLTADERVWGFLHLWHEVKYNFAFFDHVPELNWDRTRLRYLPLVKRDQSDADYYRLLQRCLATLRDGHTSVPLSEPNDQPPIRTQIVEGKVLIVDVAADLQPSEAPLSLGLEITHLDGRSVAEVLAQEVYPYISASTPQDRDRRAGDQLLRGSVGTQVTLTLKNPDSAPRDVALTRVDRRQLPWFAGKRPLLEARDLADGIVYVALNSFDSGKVVQQFDGLFDKIRQARGLVLDVRENGGGSSSHGYAVIGRLIREPLPESTWKTRQYLPARRAWGEPEKWYTGEPAWVFPRGDDPYLGPVAVLIGPGTVSAAEDFLIPLRMGRRAVLVGRKTAGTTGQPLMVDLPGGKQARICAKRDSYPDGTEFVGVGVMPDVEVEPTREDIAQRRDAVLAAAVEVLQRASASQPASAP